MRVLILICIYFILTSTTCHKEPNEHYCLTFKNKSNKKLNLFLNDSFKCYLLNNQHYAVNVNSDETINDFYCQGSSSWEYFLNRGGKFYILFYNRDSVINLDCDTIEKYQPYYKKILLSLDSLNQNNWTITYP